MRTKVLFVCYANMIRSQMAEGFARELGDAFLDVYSAGVYPTGVVSEEAVGVMDERGIDISQQYSKGLRDVPIEEMDYVVSLTNVPARTMCPPGFAGVALDWEVEDPVGRPLEQFRITRDIVEARVRQLVKQIWRDGSPAKE